MTPIEAYELALQKIDELKEGGIKVTIKPSASRDDKDTVKKYNKKVRIPPDKWVRARFKIANDEEATKVHEAANYLGMCGMAFDTGGGAGLRDWELDWSFRYFGGVNQEWMARRDDIEDEIKRLSSE